MSMNCGDRLGLAGKTLAAPEPSSPVSLGKSLLAYSPERKKKSLLRRIGPPSVPM